MTRRPDWPELLAAEERRCRHRPFAWGVHDCALMAADVVKTMTGVDYMADLRGRYRTAIGAVRKLKRLGGLEAAITARLGAGKPGKAATRGDVVLFVPAPELMPTTGVCLGEQCMFPGPIGTELRPTARAAIAWSI